jgi:tetratricopeptide (TPR) repeat protein
LLAAAEAAMASNDLDLAERQCQQVLQSDPKSVSGRRLAGIIASKKGRADYAVENLPAVTEENDLEALYWLAVSQRSLHRFEDAAKNFKKASELAPQSAVTYHELGLCLAATRDFLGAIAAFQKAIDLQPNAAPLWHSLGSAYQSIGSYKEAAEAFDTAISISPNDIHGYIAMAHLGLESNDKQSALWFFRKAYGIEPNSFRGQLQLAHALVQERQFTEADVLLRKLIQMKPNAATPYGLLASVMHNLGRFDEASELTEKAIALDPLRTSYYSQYVSQRKISEKDRPFIETMKRMVIDPQFGPIGAKDLYFAIGKAFNDLKSYEEAMDAYDRGNAIAYENLPPEMRPDREGYVRSLDRLVEFYTRERIAAEATKVGSQSNRPIFIIGMARSGTTLLDQILSSHPKVGSAGELNFWRAKWGEAVRPEGGYNFSPQVPDEFLELLAKYDAFSERVIDKMPSNYLNLGLIRTYFPEAIFLHSKRHPIDNCISMYTTPGLPADFVHNKEDIVYIYEQYQRMMEYWTSVVPADRMMEVQYEDLLEDTEAVIRTVLEFCGLEWDPACLEHDQNTKSISTPSAWQARQPIYKTSMERWRNYEGWLGAFGKLMPEQSKSRSSPPE